MAFGIPRTPLMMPMIGMIGRPQISATSTARELVLDHGKPVLSI
jgi:hypothetical protein